MEKNRGSQGEKVCKDCGGTGVIDTGNNDLPCTCGAGRDAIFNVAGREQVTGGQLLREWEEQEKLPLPDYLK